MNKLGCLQAAKKIAIGEGENTYGSPEDNLELIAHFWSDYLYCEVTPIDVANMMILLNVARAVTGEFKTDNYIDIAGYAACACEIGDMGVIAVKKI